MAAGIIIKIIGCKVQKYPAEFSWLYSSNIYWFFPSLQTRFNYIHFKILFCSIKKAYYIYTSSYNCFHSTYKTEIWNFSLRVSRTANFSNSTFCKLFSPEYQIIICLRLLLNMCYIIIVIFDNGTSFLAPKDISLIKDVEKA